MLPSLIFGRSGSMEGDTGLFLLEGSLEGVFLSPSEIRRVGSKREGYEFSASVHRQDHTKEQPQFFNKSLGWCQSIEDMGYMLSDYGSNLRDSITQFATGEESILANFSLTKFADRKYIGDFVGLVPQTRVIKAILREEGCKTKRTILFGTGVPQNRGGKTWLVSPHGFPREEWENVIAPLDPIDLGFLPKRNRLWMVITNAVPIISGNLRLQAGEKLPRILHGQLNDSKLAETYEQYIGAAVSRRGSVDMGLEMTKALLTTALPPQQAAEECFGLDETVIDIEDDDGMW